MWFLWCGKFCTGVVTKIFDSVVVLKRTGEHDIGMSKREVFHSYEAARAWADKNGK